MKMNKVCTNLNQDFTEEEMTTARNNIRAASTENLNTLNGAVGNLTYRVDSIEQQLAQEDYELVQQLLPYDANNTSLLDKEIVTGYKEYVGNIGFTTTSSGNMSICAFDINGNLIYPHQCINITGAETGKTNFVPFTFKEKGPEIIGHIGIKGSSNSNANITHLFYVGKKGE